MRGLFELIYTKPKSNFREYKHQKPLIRSESKNSSFSAIFWLPFFKKLQKPMLHKPEYNPDSFAHWTELTVRFRDLDALNHVNNAVYNTYFEEARINFINKIPEFKKSMSKGKSFMLVHIELDYIKPIELHETILVGTSVEEYGNTSIKGYQAIYSKVDSELKAVAKTTGVWFDLEANKPTKLPEIKDRDKYLYKIRDNG